tara:strand:- start:6079 stop:6801 length:723 start_codon:yes stop_codon:yes gene_type:complete
MNALFGHGLFSVILLIVFAAAFTVAQIYEPFKLQFSRDQSADSQPWVWMESPPSLLTDNLLFLNSSFIYLPSDFSQGTTDLSTRLPVSPVLNSYSPSFVVGDPWIKTLTDREMFSPLPTSNILSSTFLRRPLSTFGKSEKLHFTKHEHGPPLLEIFVHGRQNPLISKPFPLSNLDQASKDELWRKVEFVFTIFNNSLAGPPVSAKSSGNESVDELLLSEIVQLAPSLALADGYYLATVSP